MGKIAVPLIFFLFINTFLIAQKEKSYHLTSPDGNISVSVQTGAKLVWDVQSSGQQIIAPSTISLQLQGGEVLGNNTKIVSSSVQKINKMFAALHYKKDSVQDNCSQLTLQCKGDYGIIFRAYNDGVAYRFFTKKKGQIIIQSEEANFNFANDDSAYIPYVNDPYPDIYSLSFESLYQHIKISEFKKDTLAFLPVLIDVGSGKKVAILEADLEDYPGMFVQHNAGTTGLSGKFAPYVLEEKTGGHNNLQSMVTKRADYIGSTEGTRNFPWRIAVISNSDKELLNNDMVYKLASPSRVTDVSWIKPGKVAWDWWNDWNISHVDFRAGINTATYLYYIDFAAAHNIEYILLDEGWAPPDDIMKIIPQVDLQKIIDYGKQKNVGVWLWGGALPIDNKIEEAFTRYSQMGIRGFKIDFMNRDDEKMVQFYYRVSKAAAEHKLMLDFHGAYKPTGLQRTYPNVVNVEGVRGLENVKWSTVDMPGYDVTIPFIRMLAGPLDYTPGAMKNASKQSFRAINSTPMSQGTRCHQLAMYVVYEAPFEMLSDNPTNYMREPESLKFIADIPTTFDETVALESKVGDYAAIARRKGSTWYIGAMTNWDARDINIDLSFLPAGNYEAEVFKDGINADRDATDYKRETIKVSSGDKLSVHLSTGGGWAAKIYKRP